LAITLGLALATKWSAIYYAVLFVVLLLVWDFKRRALTALSARQCVLRWLRNDALPALHMPFLAIAVYLTSWAGWFASSDAWNRNWASDHPAAGLMRFVPDSLRSLLDYHKGMLSFHTSLDSPHSYQANPWTWPLMIRPTSFFYEANPTCGATQCAQEVIPLGNPAIWWVGVIALLAIALTALKYGNRNFLRTAQFLPFTQLCSSHLPCWQSRWQLRHIENLAECCELEIGKFLRPYLATY
jgi:dolichyl-phosphate-mannose--protein O-mannosyl transferase